MPVIDEVRRFAVNGHVMINQKRQACERCGNAVEIGEGVAYLVLREDAEYRPQSEWYEWAVVHSDRAACAEYARIHFPETYERLVQVGVY